MTNPGTHEPLPDGMFGDPIDAPEPPVRVPLSEMLEYALSYWWERDGEQAPTQIKNVGQARAYWLGRDGDTDGFDAWMKMGGYPREMFDA